jgi:NADPH-dependent 2,4-dienoyl-CoA reductase/sulfur reductase-like enzyme
MNSSSNRPQLRKPNPVKSIALRAVAALSVAALLIAPLAVRAEGVAAPSRPDLLVVGGTPAGVAAALAAARRGERVTLISATGDLGGVLTGAMMDQWDLNLAPDGAPIEDGIFEEMYARLGDVFAPEAAAGALARMVAEQPPPAVAPSPAALPWTE